MPDADHAGITIHFEVEGEGPPLVLQHGFTSKLKSWSWFGYVEALKPTYRLILVDARAHGASDKPHEPGAYALPLRVGDIVAVLDTLGVDKRITGATRWADGSASAWRRTRPSAFSR